MYSDMYDAEKACIFMYTCIHVYTTSGHIGIHRYSRTLTLTLLGMYTHVYRGSWHVYTCTYTCIHINLYMNTRGFTNDTTCIPLEYTCKLGHVYTCMVHVYTCVLSVCIHVYPYMTGRGIHVNTRIKLGHV